MWFGFGGFGRRRGGWGGSFMQPLPQGKRRKMLKILKEVRDENNGKWNFAKSRTIFSQLYPGESLPCTKTFSNLAKNWEDYGTVGDPKWDDRHRGPDGPWRDAVISEVTKNPKTTIKEVAERLCIPKMAAQNILKEAGWKKGKGFTKARTQVTPAKTPARKTPKGLAPRVVFKTSTPSSSSSQAVQSPIDSDPVVISDDEDMSGSDSEQI